MSSSKKVFMSRSTEDVAFAGELARLMTDRGSEVVTLPEMPSIDSWAGSLREAIEQTSALVLVIPGRGTPNRNSVWFEAGAAKAMGKRILAILPPGGMSGEVPSDLADIVILDADRRPLGEIADILVQAVPAEERASAA